MTARTILRYAILLPAIATLTTIAAAQQVVNGSLDDGSLYEFQVPVNWNGSLVLFAHEYVDPNSEPVLKLPPYANPWSVILPNLRPYLLGEGYAVGYSSYASYGWAVDSAIRDTHALRGVFSNVFGKPERTYLVGVSMGSLVVTHLAEHYPQQYSGVLALCGVLGGTRAELKYAYNARVLYDLFFSSGHFGSFGYILPGGVDEYTNVPFGLNDPAFAGALGNLLQGMSTEPYFPTWQYLATAGIPGISPEEMIEGSIWAIGTALVFSPDFLTRTHGHLAFDNHDTVYHDSLTPTLDPLINKYVERYEGTVDALLYLDRYYQPTGDLNIPMYTLHTTRDPNVPFWHEEMYAGFVNQRGKSGNLYQQSVDAFRHCAFSNEQVSNAFDALTVWVSTGNRPE